MPPEDLNWAEFESAIAEVEQSLISLKERYNQVQRDRTHQDELKGQLDFIRRQRRPNSSELKAELQQIKQQLETIELNLESRLFNWGSLREAFWQAVRFGGIGVIIGWLLKSLVR